MNEEDVSVYAFATALFCARATAAGIAETRAAGALRGACDALSETEAQLCGELLTFQARYRAGRRNGESLLIVSFGGYFVRSVCILRVMEYVYFTIIHKKLRSTP